MDFTFTDEQRLLHEGVTRLLSDTYGFAARRNAMAEADGWSRAQWHRFAEMGLLGLPFAADHGGYGGGAAELSIIMQAFGAALVVEPYLATVVCGGGLIERAGSAEQRATLIPKIAAGELILAFAQAEPRSRYELGWVETTARADGNVWIIDGRKQHVLGGNAADMFVVSARTAGSAGDPDGVSLFLVRADEAGLALRGYPLQDGTHAAELTFEGVRVGCDAVVGEVGQCLPVISRVIDRVIAALCCEAVGAMTEAHRMTLDYLKVRKQFGATIGSFQALQHRAVEMYVQLELARSMALFGIMSCEDPNPAAASRAVSATKVQIARAARHIGQEAVQLHGGIGMTDEYAAGHYFRRLSMIELQFGDLRHHLAIVAAGSLI